MNDTHNAKEWYVPTERTDYLSQQHILRYNFAVDKLWSGARVLDVACGAGYGTHVLSKHDVEIVGVDYDETAIQFAQSRYPSLKFQLGNALELSFSDSIFDIVVSFETIEHVTDANAFIAEMQRILVPGGLLIISTPNIRYTSHPDYHLKEYNISEFYHLFEDYFPLTENFCQYFLMKDYFVDVLRRMLPKPVAHLLRKGGLKNNLLNLMTKRDTVKHENSPYAVVSFKSSKQNLLRIMINIAHMES